MITQWLEDGRANQVKVLESDDSGKIKEVKYKKGTQVWKLVNYAMTAAEEMLQDENDGSPVKELNEYEKLRMMRIERNANKLASYITMYGLQPRHKLHTSYRSFHFTRYLLAFNQ